MSMAFQISEDDIANVLASNPRGPNYTAGKSVEEMAEALMTELDMDEIEAAALNGDDMDEQTDYAHDEIKRQLEVAGILAAPQRQ